MPQLGRNAAHQPHWAAYNLLFHSALPAFDGEKSHTKEASHKVMGDCTCKYRSVLASHAVSWAPGRHQQPSVPAEDLSVFLFWRLAATHGLRRSTTAMPRCRAPWPLPALPCIAVYFWKALPLLLLAQVPVRCAAGSEAVSELRGLRRSTRWRNEWPPASSLPTIEPLPLPGAIGGANCQSCHHPSCRQDAMT